MALGRRRHRPCRGLVEEEKEPRKVGGRIVEVRAVALFLFLRVCEAADPDVRGGASTGGYSAWIVGWLVAKLDLARRKFWPVDFFFLKGKDFGP